MKLTPVQERLLRAMARTPNPQSLDDLAGATGVTHNAVMEAIKRLRRKGLTVSHGKRGNSCGWIPTHVMAPCGGSKVLAYYGEPVEMFVVALFSSGDTWRYPLNDLKLEAPPCWMPLPPKPTQGCK